MVFSPSFGWQELRTTEFYTVPGQLEEPSELSVARRDMVNGRLGRYAVWINDEGQAWSDPVAEGKRPDTTREKAIRFGLPVEARFVCLIAHSEVSGQPFAGVAELDLFTQ